MENERLKITLDNADKIYYAGQTIKGEIWMNLTKRSKIRFIKIQIIGKGKCKWMEILRKSSSNLETGATAPRSIFYSSNEIYVHTEQPLAVFQPRGVVLNAGEHTFEFSMPLDGQLPSSFMGKYGSIKYKLHVIINRKWSFLEHYTIPLTVVKHMPLPSIYRTNPTSLEKQSTKTISLFGRRPITVLAMLPEDFAARGEPMRICVTVTNNSNSNVDKLRFTVLQYVCYYSHEPLRIKKMQRLKIACKETGSVQKKSERSFAHELVMPATAQPSDDEVSGIINISYELRVEAVLRSFFKNIVLKFPFKLYSSGGAIESRETTLQPPPDYPPQENARGNPFESPASVAIATAYPSLDSSLASPSHSSTQYSGGSDSPHSTISDSSAATLSPAVGGLNDFSYAGSSGSSQFNSPSARASLRSYSNVPYMPYPSSPLTNSYPPPTHLPPYPLAESLQYTLMMTPSPPPLSALNQLPSSSRMSSSFFHGRPQELPPSYEELFGNATAPPAMHK